MAPLAKHKLHAYVEINVQKSKSRKGVASPLQALRLRPPRRVLGHLWAKGTQVQELRQEIGLEPSKFNKLVYSVRNIARQHLNLTRPYEEQDEQSWQRFVQKVREVHPYFNQFEDQWPLAIYVCKYITSYLARNAMTESVKTSARLNDSYLHATISAKIQISFEAIPRPTVDDEIHLVDVNTRSDELQVAMGLMCRKIYDEFIGCMQNISSKHLFTDKLFCQQDEWQWRTFVKEICIQFPFVKQYEDVWPVEIYMKKYLECRFDAVAQDDTVGRLERIRTRAVTRELGAPVQRAITSDSGSKPALAPAKSYRSTFRALLSGQVPPATGFTRQVLVYEKTHRYGAAMKAQHDLLKQFRHDGIITDQQYSMLADGLSKVVLPFL